MSKNLYTSIQKTVTSLIKEVNPRNRDIISRRFGLKNNKSETLEAIGKSYGITRERVRQIEEFTIKQISKSISDNDDVKKYVSWAKGFIESKGGVMREKELFKSFSGRETDSPYNRSLMFVLSIDGGLIRFSENNEFKTFWAADAQRLDSFKNSVDSLIKSFERNKEAVSVADLGTFAQKNSIGNIEACLSVSKLLDSNIFGEVGLALWPSIKPRGVRDKAYLILKKENSPRHFGEIAELINKTGFSDRKANTQTVHNELIKDSRFVLVGRGMYALSEWGYSSGTVKDVLVDILNKSSKPLSKASLVAKVMDARMVKENTILLNLQDSKMFSRKEDGTYTLRKA